MRAVQIDRYGRRPFVPRDYEAVIVPGALVRADGSPSGALLRRVGLGISLVKAGWAPRIVVSGRGGGGRREADVMAELALRSGIAPECITREREATNTAENAALTRAMLDVRRVLVATDTSHVLRCEREFSAHFEVVGVAGAPLATRSRIRQALREALREAWFL